ncbi:MAG: sortase [Patescibacteria group bacterium]|nr:sortase [Patescibacteria group bacterium]
MKRFIMPTIAFFVTFVLVFSLFSGVFERVTYFFMPSPKIEKNEEKEDFGVPDVWLAQYDVILESFIDAKADIDNDGLTLVEEYEYHTDPTNPDTDADGYADGTEVNNGYSPTGEGIMDTNKNEIPDKWEKEIAGGLVDDVFDDFDNDGLTYYDEYIQGTDPKKKDTDGDGYSDGDEVHNGYEPASPGETRPQVTLAIDKINIDVPVILSNSADEAALQEDLNNGVIHYPGMAMPGQRGNVYIAGHSSNYVWSKGAYNYAFRQLNDLVVNDVIVIKTKMSTGKEIEYKYIITLKEEVSPDDGRIFADTQSQELTLTTCWPLGTNARRIMVKAQLDEA